MNESPLQAAFFRARYGTRWDRLVAWYTHGPYCHCELIFPYGVMFSAIRGRGLRFARFEQPEQYDLLPLRCTPTSDKRATLWCVDHQGEPYSTIEMLACIFPLRRRIVEEPGQWYCSMVLAHLVNRFCDYVDDANERMCPNELYRWLKQEG
jgi:hypothetical protein